VRVPGQPRRQQRRESQRLRFYARAERVERRGLLIALACGVVALAALWGLLSG